MRRALLALLAVIAGVVVAMIVGRALPGPPAGVPDAPRAAPAVVTDADDAAGPAATGDARLPDGPAGSGRPRSLRGSRTDGGLALDAAGHFVPTLDARRLFDYFLTATGEVAPDALRARIVAEIERRLPPDAAAEAMAVLDRYLGYRERVRALAEHGDGSDLDARLAKLVALRREVLGPDTADAFFADEEAETRTLLATRRINEDTSLTPEERARRVEAAWAEHEADLPDEVRAARATARLADTLRRAESEIRDAGGSPAEVQAMRERLAGPAAAARLADLDQQRAAWTARVDAFRTARTQLTNDSSLDPPARQAAIERLLEESFTPAERLRIQALDRIAASP